MVTETLTVSRGKTDSMSNRSNTAHTVEGVLAWGIGSRGSGRFRFDIDRQESASVTARLYVQRGADVQARDRITRANGQAYAVVGHSLWDQQNPLTGHDFGWMTFEIVSTDG